MPDVGFGKIPLDNISDPASGNPVGFFLRKTGVWTYDFTKLGGTVGAIPLTGPALPLGAVVDGGYIDQVVTGAQAANTVNLQLEAAADLLAAIQFNFVAPILKAVVPVSGAAAVKTTTATRVPTLNVTTTAVTAGKFYLVLYFLVDSVT
jgi:hypothetical protein